MYTKTQLQIAAIQKQIAAEKVKNVFAAKQKIKNLQVKAMAEIRQAVWNNYLAQ